MSNIIERKKDINISSRKCPNCKKTMNNPRKNKIFCSNKCRFQHWARLHPRVAIISLLILFIPGICFPNQKTINLDLWADAIYIAEGKKKAVVPYGIFYEGCDWDHVDYCRKICKNTVYNTLVKYRDSRCKEGESDIDCIQRRYCPLNADNDPHGLNKNWKKNVKFYLKKTN